jgi:hypothetical protein
VSTEILRKDLCTISGLDWVEAAVDQQPGDHQDHQGTAQQQIRTRAAVPNRPAGDGGAWVVCDPVRLERPGWQPGTG